jgi:PAS domain S-box-containing protein
MISVLYVDDESALLEVTKNFMERGGGFKVDTAISAREAIEKLKAERYDALVVDYLMPEMDGIELLRYLRPRCNGLPFILFTGNGGEEVAIEALNAGADFYVQKKGSPRTQFAELETKIRSAVARRQNDLALRKSEELLRSLLEDLADIIYSVNEEGLVTYISPRIRRFGYEPKDLIGRDFATLVCAEDIPTVARGFADVKQGRSVSFAFRITDPGGQSHNVRASCSPRTDHGQFTGGLGLLGDITEAPQDAEELRGYADLNLALFNLSPDGMMVIDPATGKLVEINDEACLLLGCTREEMSGHNLNEWEDADALQKIREMIPGILQKGESTFDTRHMAKDGGIHDIVGSARVLNDGITHKIWIILHDATEENEQKRDKDRQVQELGEVFEQSPVAQLMISPDGQIIRVNLAGEGLLGSPAPDIIGRNLAGFIDNGGKERFFNVLDELKRSGSTPAARFSLTSQEGIRWVVSLDGKVICEKEGGICQILVTLTNITEQEKKAADLEAVAAAACGVIAGAREGIFVCSPDQYITGWNPAMEDITGIAERDALGQNLNDVLPFLKKEGTDTPADRALAGEIIASADVRYEYSATGKQGWARSIFSPLRDTSGKITGVIGVVQEITTRTKNVLMIKAEHRLYAIGAHISATAPAVRDLEMLLSDTCSIAVDGDAICTAWIGLFDRAAGILRPVAHAGTGEGLPTEGYRVSGDEQAGCLAGDAVRTGSPVVSGDTRTDPAAQLWCNDTFHHGCRSAAAIPFRLKGEIVGVITLCSREPFAFSTENAEVLVLLGSTLSSALDLLDKKTLQRRAGKGGHGSWERTRFLAEGLESGAVPFAAVYADGSTGAVNAALCALLGFTEDELLSFPFANLFDLPEQFTERFQQVHATKKPDRFEGGIRKKEGSVIFADLVLQVIPDENSVQTCVGIFISDISDREREIEILKKDRQDYRDFFEKTPAATVITTPEGSVLAANPAACYLLGRKKDEICLAGGGKGLAGDGDPRFVELVRTCQEAGSARGELRLMKGDGTAFDVEVAASRFLDQNNQPVLSLALMDATSTRKTADAHVQEQELILAMLDSLPNPVRRSDASGTWLFFNKAWCAFTGRTPEAEQGDGWMEGIHPDDRAHYRETLKNQAEHTGLPGAEYRLMHHSGEYRWIREICTPAGTGSGFTFSCYVIQAVRLAEAALDEERAHSRAILETMTEATLLASDRILDCNPAATRLFSCSREDLIGQILPVYSPQHQPDGRPSLDAMQKYLEAARAGTPQTFPWLGTRRDGSAIETRITLTAIGNHGKMEVLAVIMDMTEINRSNREIQRLSVYPEMNPNPVIEIQPDRTISYANPATTAVLSSLGLPYDPAAFLPVDFDTIAGALDPTQPMITSREVQLKERSFHESICAAPGHAPLRIYANDITDRVQAMESLAYANHKLGILTSITRHDIQNKLTGVMGYLDLLRGSLHEPQQIDFLDKAESSADAIRHHIDFTKDYESLGGTAPVWQEIAPILADVRSHFDMGGIGFEGPSTGFAVFADPMFAKVLYNLCDNSMRHGVHVRHIRIHCEPAGSGCMLVYEDDGVGIPQDKKDLIFERGFTTSSGLGKSSGLGLFLARDILAITGITIKETGVPGMGTRFEMVIPPGKWRCEPAD